MGSQPSAAAVSVAPMAIGAVEHTHTRFVRNCPECLWIKHERSWQKAVAFKDSVSGQMVTPIIKKPSHLGGSFAIGCCVCARFLSSGGASDKLARKNAFARFEVCAPTTMQKTELVKHCNSELHVRAMRFFSAGSSHSIGSAIAPTPLKKEIPIGSQPACTDARGSQPELLEGVLVNGQASPASRVPRAERFVWAIQTCQRGGTFRDYENWCKA